MSRFDYDLFVIGAGSGGVRASRLAGAAGARVAIAESWRVGGTCVLRGCVPKKLLVMASHYAEDFVDAAGFGWDVGDHRLDWPRLIATKNRELDRLNGIYLNLLRNANVALFENRAQLVDAQTIALDSGKTVTAERIVVAVGGTPSLPSIPGIECAITSNEALDLAALPRAITIVGSGYIAVEFASLFAAIGVEVDLVFRAEHVLRGFDADIREALDGELAKKSIRLHPRTEVSRLDRQSDGRIAVTVGSGGAPLLADQVLYATGRKPNTASLGLTEAGVAMAPDGAIIVNARSQTSQPSVFAVGDVTNRVNLTPVALAEANHLIDWLFRGRDVPMDYDNLPSAVFCQPPVAVVGLSEEAARARFGAIDIYLSRFRPMRHTLSGRDERNLLKLVVKQDDQRVVGCHMLGGDAPEIMQGLAIALRCGATKAQFDATIGIHPTAAEEFVTMREKSR